MRLLFRNTNGKYKFRDLDDDDPIPPYAILSHKWLADTEEPTFEDLTNGSGKEKLGYKKIRFCGDQARQDGLQYFWADTCCINKGNYAELSLSINSMFRWYHNATPMLRPSLGCFDNGAEGKRSIDRVHLGAGFSDKQMVH